MLAPLCPAATRFHSLPSSFFLYVSLRLLAHISRSPLTLCTIPPFRVPRLCATPCPASSHSLFRVLLLPPLFFCPLLISPSLMKQAFKLESRRRLLRGSSAGPRALRLETQAVASATTQRRKNSASETTEGTDSLTLEGYGTRRTSSSDALSTNPRLR